jgi:hypothetical protein
VDALPAQQLLPVLPTVSLKPAAKVPSGDRGREVLTVESVS